MAPPLPWDSTPAPSGPHIGLKLTLPIPPGEDVFIGITKKGGYVEIDTDFQTFFSLDIVVTIAVAVLFPGDVKFIYQAEAIKAAKPLPGTSHTETLGAKESLLLAIGVYGDGEDPDLPPLQFNYKVFAGIGFAHESKPGEKSVGVGGVYDVQASVQYPIGPIALVEVGNQSSGTASFRDSQRCRQVHSS